MVDLEPLQPVLKINIPQVGPGTTAAGATAPQGCPLLAPSHSLASERIQRPGLALAVWPTFSDFAAQRAEFDEFDARTA